MSIVREILRSQNITIGDVSLRYEHFDQADKDVMLVVHNASLPRFRQLRPHYVAQGGSLELPNGVRVWLQHGATQKRISLEIDNPDGLPITHGRLWERKPRVVD